MQKTRISLIELLPAAHCPRRDAKAWGSRFIFVFGISLRFICVFPYILVLYFGAAVSAAQDEIPRPWVAGLFLWPISQGFVNFKTKTYLDLELTWFD